MKTKDVKHSYSVEKCLEHTKPSQLCLNDLDYFKAVLDSLTDKACKQTHYSKLNEWTEPVFDVVHNMLKKYGFKSGDMVANEKNVDAMFWWRIYDVVSNVIYSRNMKPTVLVAIHHSSAFDRNEALKKDIQVIIDHFKK